MYDRSRIFASTVIGWLSKAETAAHVFATLVRRVCSMHPSCVIFTLRGKRKGVGTSTDASVMFHALASFCPCLVFV